MQRIEFALVREQLDDDDGAGKSQCHRDIKRLHHITAHAEDDQEAEEDGECELPQPGRQRHRPDVAQVVQVEPQADQEQQHRDPGLRQQVDLVMRLNETQHRRPGHNADDDVGDQHRLMQAHRDETGAGGYAQQQRDFCERGSVCGLWRHCSISGQGGTGRRGIQGRLDPAIIPRRVQQIAHAGNPQPTNRHHPGYFQPQNTPRFITDPLKPFCD